MLDPSRLDPWASGYLEIPWFWRAASSNSKVPILHALINFHGLDPSRLDNQGLEIHRVLIAKVLMHCIFKL